MRGGEWYLEKRGSRKILAGSRNLGSVFDKSRSLVFAWFVFTFFESRNFLPKSLGLGFLTRISASRRVSDFTIRHPSGGVLPYMACTGMCPEGVLPDKSDRGSRRKFLRTPLKGTRNLFQYGRVPNSFPPLRGTNSTTTNYITGTANFNCNKDNFRTLSCQGLFESNCHKS